MSKHAQRTKLQCVFCAHKTFHTTAYSEDTFVRVTDGCWHQTDEPAIYRLFRCENCSQLSLHIWSHFHSPETEFGEQVYPRPVTYFDQDSLPLAVRDAWKQAESVRRHSFSAHAVMVRRLLELIVKLHGIEERNLSKSIMILVEKTQMPPLLYEALSILRIEGNRGAHYSEIEIDEISADMISELLFMIIDYLYINPDRIKTISQYLNQIQ
ncbi:DUF4145 domain-containing protein [Burkholderia cenocepacia]|uniref:DUF4145 domain-containing protein n=1 Tax=Burkholderia cenocepacia TaxID=95486 RepID=UPI0024B6698B|nr:DUF4145 domain-containing protein [Burkholderia cenocepacia]MDI9681359.1 DUF4145 domain-containing protein [Burkholderia cenocepacia]MDR8037194.1 DUF4145 domain-containing protein [Burkholderia cenocepacia]